MARKIILLVAALFLTQLMGCRYAELPSKDQAAAIQSLVTSVGIVVGGGWAFWRWSLSEFLRRRSEIPSFDGAISAESIAVNEKQEVITVVCKWRNAGLVPLSVNTSETRVTAYLIPEQTELGPIGPRLNNLKELYVRKPWEHWPTTILEPGTTSEIQVHFLVEARCPYVFSCRLEAVSKPRSTTKQVWVRELVWRSSALRDSVGHEAQPSIPISA